MDRDCAVCKKTGTNYQRCSRCKDTYYCSRDCQTKDWPTHKKDCIPPEQRPKMPDEEVVVGYVECTTYEDCRNYLVQHPELISKPLADEMYEKAFFTLKTHSPEFGARFARNAQIIQYLLDIRKASGGQQDISLFFSRILDPTNSEYRRNFDMEYQNFVKRVLKRHKEREAEEKKKAEEEEQKKESRVEEIKD